MPVFRLSVSLLATALLLAACGGTVAPSPVVDAPAPAAIEETQDPVAALALSGPAVLTTYADIAFAAYSDSVALAEALQQALETLVAHPGEETHAAAKAAWLAAREPYVQTEAFRFYGGPIDGEDGPEGLINAWPLDEAYIDYVAGDAAAGIINNTADFPAITAELLVALNEQGGEKNIAAGYHAIEFLLWGQDFFDDSAGQRAYTDYVAGQAPNAGRRSQYLLLAGEQLVANLTGVRDAWDPAIAGNYRADFLALPPADAVQRILTGAGVLSKSELPGERIYTAYDNQDQEDEHSCFSDNTHRDIIGNAQSIANVLTGEYTRSDGTVISGAGVDDLLAAADPALGEQLVAQLEAVMAQVTALHSPFDQAILLEQQRPAVLDAVFALQDLGDLVAGAGAALGVTINTALPE